MISTIDHDFSDFRQIVAARSLSLTRHKDHHADTSYTSIMMMGLIFILSEQPLVYNISNNDN